MFNLKLEKKLMKSSSELFDKRNAREFFELLEKRNKLSNAYLILCSNENYAQETAAEIAGILTQTNNIKGEPESSNPDIIWLKPEDKTSSIKVDAIRNISSRVSLRPYEALRKVVVISQAYRMNEAAQNAFLKTLEEPPADTIIFLLSNEIVGLLETIISRCKIIRLNSQVILKDDNFISTGNYKYIEDFIKVENNNYLDYFNFEDKSDFRKALKTLYCFFRDAAYIKQDIDSKNLLLVGSSRDYREYINRFDSKKIPRIIEIFERMYQYSLANVNLRLSQLDTACLVQETMES
jgi:hypothetical protein